MEHTKRQPRANRLDRLDELAWLLQLHGARVVRVLDGVMVALDREADAARAYVVVTSSWPGGSWPGGSWRGGSWRGGRRWLAWGPTRSMGHPAGDVEAAALALLGYLHTAPVGHRPPAWPDPIRDCTGTGRPRGRLRRLRARIDARSSGQAGEQADGRFDVVAGGRW